MGERYLTSGAASHALGGVIDPGEALDALLSELRRQKSEGVRLVSVSAESLQALRALSGAPTTPAAPAPRPVAAAPSPVPVPVRRDVPPTPAAAAPVPKPAPVPRPVVRPAAQSTIVTAPPVGDPPVFTLPEGSKAERMRALVELIENCAETRRHLEPGHRPVIGHGALDAKVFLIGEAPILEEAEAGQPFAGASGEILRKILKAADLRDEDVYFAPLMTWRPEPPTKFGKRPPNAREVAFSLPYLRAQVDIVRPQVVIALGAQALEALIPGVHKITSARGVWREFAGIPLMPTFHPNYILHNSSLSTKRAAWEDFLQVMEKLGLPISEKQRGFFLPVAKPADESAD
jgi:uracil-DNA glycosylase family 4